MKILNIHQGKRKGFTLLEVIIAFGIFSSITLIALNLFVTATGAQKRVASTQKVQEDMRYVIEAVTQQIRLGSINYAFYRDPDANPATADAIDLYPDVSLTPPSTLALIDSEGRYIYFVLDTTDPNQQRIVYCQFTSATDRCTSSNWINITPTQISIQSLKFYITPSADPFPASIVSTGRTCADDSECQNSPDFVSYRCDTGDSVCRYFSDGQNLQPKVKIAVSSRGAIGQPAEQGHISLQTIVSTRGVQSGVTNPWYE